MRWSILLRFRLKFSSVSLAFEKLGLRPNEDLSVWTFGISIQQYDLVSTKKPNMDT